MKQVQNESLLVYQPVPAPIDKIKNKYRWRMIVKGKVTASILDILKYSTQTPELTKMLNTSIIVDLNPNSLQ